MNKAILCVDDEKTILDTLIPQLHEFFGDDFTYEKAESADEALEILEELSEDGYKTVLVISDWLMPGMKGDEFLINVNKKFDGVVKILLTGHAPQQAVQNAYDKGDLDYYIQKPWTIDDLTVRLEKLKTQLIK